MKKLRKVNKAKRKKERKDAQERLAQKTSFLLDHPMECCLCKKPFERTHETVKTWMVTASEEKQTVYLTCPPCWDKVESVVRKEGAQCRE